MNKLEQLKETFGKTEELKFQLVEGTFRQCDYATLNYDNDSSLAYCAKYGKIMDGWTVSNYCRGYGGCDE